MPKLYIFSNPYKNDSDFLQAQAAANCRAAVVSAAASIALGIAGVIGLGLQPDSDRADGGYISFIIYCFIIFINLATMIVAPLIRDHLAEKHPRAAEHLFSLQLFITQVMACVSIFSTQKGSSFYLEAVILMIPVAVLPVYSFWRNLFIYLLMGGLLAGIIHGMSVPIAWQDSYDLVIFIILCLAMSVLRRQWFLERFESTRELQETNVKLYLKSRTDEGTGLFNSSAMVEDIPAYAGHEVAAAIIDIDGFRAYKEVHGETEAVILLQGLTETLRSVFAGDDAHAYRYGVDEILVLAKDMPRDLFADRLRAVQTAFSAENRSMTVSIGCCYGRPENDREVRTMMTAADNSLFQAKVIGKGTVLESSDLSGMKNSGDRDTLTGLLTNASFVSQMNGQELTEDMYVLFFDLDRFQQLNKEYGFRTGDRVLKDMAEWIVQQFPGDIAFRENDHFAVLTKRTDFEERIQKIQQQLSTFDGKIYIRLRAGVYRISAKGAAAGARACVDMAKYACDSLRDKNGVGLKVYDEELDKQRESRTYVQSHFYEAIDKGYIVPYFQPIIASLSGVCTGFEALARWIDPVKGFMNPGLFVPVLEASHESYFLDFHILKQVCALIAKQDLTTWNKYVSVNFSRADFESCDLPARIDAIVSSYGIPKDLLRIEVTESAFSDSPQIRNDIKRLEDMGYLVWLDDFGSGMSSLNTLKSFHVNAAKIDLEFLRNSKDNPKALTILAQMIRLCHSIDTIALVEGVETQEQLEFVRQCGGNLIQGFYYDKPQALEAPELQDFLGQSISKEEYDYYAKAAFIDINRSPDVIFGGVQMGDVAFQMERNGDSLQYLRISDGAYVWAHRYGYSLEQRKPVVFDDAAFDKALHAAIEDAIARDHLACAAITLPGGQESWICVGVVSRLPGTDRVILMTSVVNQLHATV